jgi:hypothetical protein
MPPAIVRREIAPSSRIRGSSHERPGVAAANDNAPTHALWRKIVAAAIGTLFALALVLVGLACTGHAAELDQHPLHSSGHT